MRSVNFIRSGWIPAIRKFSRFLAKGTRNYDRSSRQYGVPKGYGIPAPIKSHTPTAEIANSAILPQSRFSFERGNPFPVAKTGLEKAVRESIADMKRHMYERWKRNLSKHSAR